jgi:vacuolar-type H+-ATPase subunit I/STV1
VVVVIDRDEALRDLAIERIKKKHEFIPHLLAYLLVNSVFVAVWVATDSGFFWPLFPILGWGIGVAFHAWDAFVKPPITERRIEREIEHLRRSA